jgi:anti-sigma regulatory factor (Ser/Thr protein kinase)
MNTAERVGSLEGPVRAVLATGFSIADLALVRAACHQVLRDAGLDDDRAGMFVCAINEAIANAVQHGGGSGTLTLLHDGEKLIAEIVDQGSGMAVEVPEHLPAATAPGGRGLWIARQMVDHMVVTTGPAGTKLRLELTHPG